MRSIRRLKAITASLSVMLLLAALTAGSAAAAEAKWSTNGEVQITGDANLTLNGGTPIKCPGVKMTALTSGPYLLSFVESISSCSGSPFPLQFASVAESSAGSYWLNNRNPGTQGSSPYGTFIRSVWTAPFINGSVSSPSHVVFNNTVIGLRQSDNLPIAVTGTMNVTKLPGGGLVTLK